MIILCVAKKAVSQSVSQSGTPTTTAKCGGGQNLKDLQGRGGGGDRRNSILEPVADNSTGWW